MADAAKDFRNKQKQKKKKLAKGVERFGLIGLGVLACISFLLLIFMFFGPGPKAKSGDSTIFAIESGEGAGILSKKLSDEHLLRVPFAFKTLTVITGAGKKFMPGEYAIPSGASPMKILNILTKGDSLKRKITIPEGWTNGMAFRRIEENTVLSGPMPELPKEGMMSPDTYQVKKGMTRADLVNQMTTRQAEIIDELWLKRAANLPIRSKEEALILASIVEKETGIASERPMVASVFVNRLREGMKLQSDPTIIYGITKGMPLGRKILKSEITKDHPWNTYVIQGLPPTPICNPGKDAIEAVLNPPKTKNLFFVADGTGGHVFAETYADHQKNVEKWREIRAKKESIETSADPELEGGRLRSSQ